MRAFVITIIFSLSAVGHDVVDYNHHLGVDISSKNIKWAKRQTSDGNVGMDYLFNLPDGYDGKTKYPLLVFLHGMGERATYSCYGCPSSNISDLLKAGPLKLVAGVDGRSSYWKRDKYKFIVVQAHLSKEHRDWYNPYVKWIIEEMKSNFAVDDNYVYLTGLSLGSIGIWKFRLGEGTYFKNNIAAAVAISGGAPNPDQQPCNKEDKIWMFHGYNDHMNAATDISRATRTRDVVNACSPDLPIKLSQYNAGHSGWNQIYNGNFFDNQSPAPLGRGDLFNLDPQGKSHSNIYEWMLSIGKDGIPYGGDTQPNRSPTISQVTNKSLKEGDELNISIVASDADGDMMDISVQGLAGIGSYDKINQVISLSPQEGSAGNYNVSIIAQDPYGAKASASFSVSVEAVVKDEPQLGESILRIHGKTPREWSQHKLNPQSNEILNANVKGNTDLSVTLKYGDKQEALSRLTIILYDKTKGAGVDLLKYVTVNKDGFATAKVPLSKFKHHIDGFVDTSSMLDRFTILPRINGIIDIQISEVALVGGSKQLLFGDGKTDLVFAPEGAVEMELLSKDASENTALVDFGWRTSGGNVTNINANEKYNYLRDSTTGKHLQAHLKIYGFNGINPNGNKSSIREFDTDSIQDSFYGNDREFQGVLAPKGTVYILGLIPGNTYKIKVSCSRMGVRDNRSTKYTIEGTVRELDCANNTDKVVEAEAVANPWGVIYVTAEKGSANNNNYGFYYVGAMSITGEFKE